MKKSFLREGQPPRRRNRPFWINLFIRSSNQRRFAEIEIPELSAGIFFFVFLFLRDVGDGNFL